MTDALEQKWEKEFLEWAYPPGKGFDDTHELVRRSAYLAACRARHAELEAAVADEQRLIRELDALINGENAAPQASLCDIVSQVAKQGLCSCAEYEDTKAKLAEANARVAAEREDAERYRWLREQIQKGPLVIAKTGHWDLESWSGDDPDWAIDDAIRARDTGEG